MTIPNPNIPRIHPVSGQVLDQPDRVAELEAEISRLRDQLWRAANCHMAARPEQFTAAADRAMEGAKLRLILTEHLRRDEAL